ncbi:unnamed protein product [Arabidopsis arenosa]|uniref:Protein kinase domain-containing protein n=1 Tax=Arabidopsis arenosa TaxID=38785 RepID=A0A8S1ZG14_ARAAE|nr:unnamed protein product [Arabidopsis arenosa]
MGCFGCSKKSSKRSETNKENNKDTVINRKFVGGTTSVVKSDKRDDQTQPSSDSTKVSPYRDVNNEGVGKEDQLSLDVKGLNLNDQVTGKKAQTFTFQELAVATGNFRSDCFLGEGGFGKVFKGTIEKLDQVVAIKQLDRNGVQGIREFVVEVLTLSLADHPNLVKLIGFCAEGDQRLLVYEYMPQGSLEDHLHDLPSGKKPLDWNTRMKIAAGAARGLAYLHDRMTPPVIYRDLKCSNILLGEDYQPKLSDFGLAKVGPSGDKTHVSTRFGVVLLELITGRKAIDNTKTRKDQNLVGWARPLFKDRRNFPKMVDPLLQGQYPVRGLYQALAISAMCVQEQPSMRPVEDAKLAERDFSGIGVLDPRNSGDRFSLFLHPLDFLTLSVMNDGEIMSIHRLEKSMAVRNESHVSLAILASSAVSPASGLVVSTNQNLKTPHNATQSQQNATQSHNATQSVNKAKQPHAV